MTDRVIEGVLDGLTVDVGELRARIDDLERDVARLSSALESHRHLTEPPRPRSMP